MSLTVKDIMTPEVVTVFPSASASQIAKIFIEQKYGGITVVDEDEHLRGMITLREFLMIFLPPYIDELIDKFAFVDDFGALERVFMEGPILELFVAEDLMNPRPLIANEEASLFKAAALMDRHNMRRLLVVDKQGRLQGMVTLFDIFRALMRGKQ